jgi:hypothetical protein
MDIKKLKNFRDVSIYFYLTSFLFITIIFTFYLYANKNNRSCQYGSTLYCNTEKTYSINTNSGMKYLKINFLDNKYLTSGLFVVGYPYSKTASVTNYYNIDYYFDAVPSSGVNNYGSVGISFNGSYGASLYLGNNNPAVSLVRNTTEFILQQNEVSTAINFLTPTENNVNNTIEYIYPGTIAVINNANSNFINSNTVSYAGLENPKGNWITLLNNNKKQHEGGCSVGSNNPVCACIDPSFISNISCENYVLNESTGIYCPPGTLNCELCTDTNGSEICGYSFCNNGILNTDGLNSLNSNNNNMGYYQDADIKGLKTGPNVTSNNYTTGGVNTGTLLPGFIYGTNGLTNYPTVQTTNFCAGKTSTTNNFDNKTTQPNSLTPASDNYNPQLATHPRFDSTKKFGF